MIWGRMTQEEGKQVVANVPLFDPVSGDTGNGKSISWVTMAGMQALGPAYAPDYGLNQRKNGEISARKDNIKNFQINARI